MISAYIVLVQGRAFSCISFYLIDLLGAESPICASDTSPVNQQNSIRASLMAPAAVGNAASHY